MIKSQNQIRIETGSSSMSDLVFLLLIFFMLTSTLISPNAVKLFLPESNNKTMAKESVTIYISDLGVGGDATSPLSRCQFQIDDTPLTATMGQDLLFYSLCLVASQSTRSQRLHFHKDDEEYQNMR